MLDIHPPHHAANSWRDFFIHIATIVLGLLIAIGLEQTVEYVHHRHQAHAARATISLELKHNIQTVQDNLKLLKRQDGELEADLERLESTAPDGPTIAALRYEWLMYRDNETAWSAARINGSLALLDAKDIKDASFYYATDESIFPVGFAYIADMDAAAALVDHARTTGKLSQQARQQLFVLTTSALGRERSMRKIQANQLDALQRTNLESK